MLSVTPQLKKLFCPEVLLCFFPNIVENCPIESIKLYDVQKLEKKDKK
jgi:hypothetical protein